MPKHHYASLDPAAIKKAENLNPQVVSGPFTMSESKPGDHYTVVRNPQYYRSDEGLPYLDKIVFRIVPDQNSILKDLQAGTADSAWFLDVTNIRRSPITALSQIPQPAMKGFISIITIPFSRTPK